MCDLAPLLVKVEEDPTLQTKRPRPVRNNSQSPLPPLSVIGEPHEGDFALKSPPDHHPITGGRGWHVRPSPDSPGNRGTQALSSSCSHRH